MQRQPLLTFIVAAGGFAGVETIGGINDFVREAIRSYPNLHSGYLRFVLVTPDDVVLPELKRTLGVYARRKLSSRGVEIVTGAKVSSISDGVVELTNGEKILATTLIWSAGTAPNALIAKLPLPKRNARIVVDPYLGVEGADRSMGSRRLLTCGGPANQRILSAHRAAGVEGRPLGGAQRGCSPVWW